MPQPRLTWYISEITPEVTRRALTLQKAILAVAEITPLDESRLINLSYFLAATRKMEYPDSAKQSIRGLAAFLPIWRTLEISEVWRFSEEEIPDALRNLWKEAFESAQELFEIDPVEAPTDALTDEQKAEAATPGSPLTSPVSNSH